MAIKLLHVSGHSDWELNQTNVCLQTSLGVHITMQRSCGTPKVQHSVMLAIRAILYSDDTGPVNLDMPYYLVH
jgi:hypothetical protein